MKLKHIGVGTYGGHATHLKLWVQEDDEHYVEYRADLGLALSFLKNRLSLNDWSKIKKPKTKWGFPRLELKEFNDLLEVKI